LGSILNQSGADPRQFTVGNENASINPRTGLPEYGLFSGGGLLGGVIGAALAIPTGGMSIAVGAGLGAGAGTLLGGGSLTDAVMAGGMFYGGASLLAGGGAFGASAKLGAATWAGGGGGAAALGNGYLATGAAGTAGAAAAPGLSGLAPGALNATGQIGLGASGGVGTLGGGLSATTAGNSVGALTMNAPLQSALAVPAATTTPSLLGNVGEWIGNNKGTLALAGLAAGAMEAPQVPPPPSGAEYFNEYDAYKDCLAAGGSESACQSSHPKGYAEIAPPPKSQWIAGMGNSSGAPGTALNPTGQVALNDQPWRQQLNQFGYAEGGAVSGRGSETSDSIPANLSNNEFVITADAVRGAGNGSIQRGASKLYDLMDKLERRAYNGR